MKQPKKKAPSAPGPWISPKYRARDWQELDLDSENEVAWSKAADIVEDRIRGRLVRWIDSIAVRRFSGFSVIALDCLLIEMLIGFIKGRSSEGNCSVYESFLTGKLTGGTEFRFSKTEASSFCKNIRNGVIHDGETRHRWIIRLGEPHAQILTRDAQNNIALNRTAFHRALKAELNLWLAKIRNGDRTLRKKMRSRMEHILEIHFAE